MIGNSELLTMAEQKTEEGSQFVRYFAPLLDALRKLGGSGTGADPAVFTRPNVDDAFPRAE
jgi:hypothetical protein